jgi:hypothetical protein
MDNLSMNKQGIHSSFTIVSREQELNKASTSIGSHDKVKGNKSQFEEGGKLNSFESSIDVDIQEKLLKQQFQDGRGRYDSKHSSLKDDRVPLSILQNGKLNQEIFPSIIPPAKHTVSTTTTNSSVWENPGSPRLFPSKLTSFNDLLKISSTMEVPTNLHIAFAGDSLTRYQYLSFVHFLKFGENNPDEVPNIVSSSQYATWYEFFKQTNMNLQPEEQCDCFRPEGHKMPWMIENRYFRDSVHNNSVSFLQKFGSKFTFKSNWNHSDVHKKHELLHKEEDNHYVIDTLSWPEFITDFVAKLEPKPLYFVFNEGIHFHRDFLSRKIRRQIIRAIKDSGMISVYKTTTKYRDHGIEVNDIIENTAIRDYELDFCKRADYCLDLSWTWMVPPDYYADYAHFIEPVYSWQNLQLFDLLHSAQK